MELNTVSEIIERLKQQSFEHDFEIEHDMLVSKSTDEKFRPADLIIDQVYRFEGESDPDDQAIIYGLTARTGTRGILVDGYGIYSDTEKSEFIKKIPLREEHDQQDNKEDKLLK